MNIIAPPWTQNLPRQLGAIAWYDACRHGTLVTGNKVSSWTDLTGNGFHLLQATDGNRPVWTDSQQRGRPGIVFAGASSQYLKTSGNAGTSNYATLVVVAKCTSVATNAPIFGGIDPATVYRKPGIRINSSTGYVEAGVRTNVGDSRRVSTTGYLDAPIICTSTYDITATTNECALLRVNGATGATVTNANNTSALGGYPLYAGTNTSVYFSGWMGELMLFNTILSASDITRVEQCLSQKWGIKLG